MELASGFAERCGADDGVAGGLPRVGGDAQGGGLAGSGETLGGLELVAGGGERANEVGLVGAKLDGAAGDGGFDGGGSDEGVAGADAGVVPGDDPGFDVEHLGGGVAALVRGERHLGGAGADGLASCAVADVEFDDCVGGEPVIGEVDDVGGGEPVDGEGGDRFDDVTAVEDRVLLGDAVAARQVPVEAFGVGGTP